MTRSGEVTLAIDASTYAGSVCVAIGTTVAATETIAMRGAQEERLMPAVARALDSAALRVADLDRVVCGAGPGSFTSLRIAAAIAKGIAMGRGCPLLTVSSLALAVAALEPIPAPGEYLATIDAMRGEVYAATCRVGDQGEVLGVGSPSVQPAESVRRLASSGVRVVGAGGSIEGAPHANGVVRVGALLAAVDRASWEPGYGRQAEAQVRWEAAHGRPLGGG